MIFGRKGRRPEAEQADDQGDAVLDDAVLDDEDLDDADLDDEGADDELQEADDDEDDAADDARADGPFDYDEVVLDDAEDVANLTRNGMTRVAFGPLIITRPESLMVQLQGDQKTNSVFTLLAHHEGSGLELALFAAPRSGGLAADLREDLIEEAGQAGGNAEVAEGPFGAEVRRVLPIEGPEGEQMFHVSRIWLVEGPRWLLRGTLMGQAALVDGDRPPADFFVEFFRNVVIRRDDEPRSPGELIHLSLPEGNAKG